MNNRFNPLSREEEYVILHTGTEYPSSGELLDNEDDGPYICRHCNAPLYRSKDLFHSSCGWPSFDNEIPIAVRRVLDGYGRQTEFLSGNCGGHLGHAFVGERLTERNVPLCVNSISMRFVDDGEVLPKKDSSMRTTG